VDEHNRHKRLKVMRACEGCRRRKIKCDAATTNTWPCSACIRLKLHCVRPNGQYDGSPTDAQGYEPSRSEFEAAQLQIPIPQQQVMGGTKQGLYPAQGSYPDSHSMYSPTGYGHAPGSQHGLQYGDVSPTVGVMDQSYGSGNVFPTPPMQHQSAHSEPSPGSYDEYGQADLTDLLGALRVDERGTGQY
jgi:hypothetical protein